ncbi:MAG: ABC transporter substrate-binding protein [Chloroflexota bacterium]
MTSSEFSRSLLARRYSRRRLLRGAGVVLGGIAGAALVGCADGGEGVTVGTASATATPAAPTPTPAVAVPRFTDALRVAIEGAPSTLDPFANASPSARTVALHFYSRLFRADTGPNRDPWASGVVPDLAEGVETQDGQTWTVTLRQGAAFHRVEPINGRPLTAEDVVASVARLQSVDSPVLARLRHWTRVQAVDGRTVRFTLAAPSADFLDELADPTLLVVAPREALEGAVDLAMTPVGSGPWMLQGRGEGGLRLIANPDLTGEAAPAVPVLELDDLAASVALERFREGRLHVAGVRAEDVLPLRAEQHEVHWRGQVPPLTSFLYCSPEQGVPWRDERFRQALSLLQDRDALTEAAYNLKAFRDAGLEAPVRWNNLLPAGFTRWWLDPASRDHGDTGRLFVHDPVEARRLLDAAGYDGSPIPFLLPADVYGPAFDVVADGIAAALSAGGVTLEVVRQDFASEYLPRTFVGDFSGIAFGHQSPFTQVGDYFARMFGRDETNHGRVRDEVIDDLVAAQAATLDADERRPIIHDIQRRNAAGMYYVPAQAGVAPLWTAYQPYVRGIRLGRGAGVGAEVHPFLSLEG